jgi:ADP-ribose pyrophosphatase
MQWSILKQRSLYKGFFNLSEFDIQHELFEGGDIVIKRELLDRSHAAGILPYDPVRDEVVLVEQFRIGAAGQKPEGPWMIEVIAGYREEGEEPDVVVEREAIEEADCKVTDIEPICRYYSSPGSSNEQIHLYVGRCESEGLGGAHGLGLAHEGEDIRVHVLTSQTAFDWLDSGRIDNAMAIISLQWFRLNREALRQRWLGTE